MVDFIHPLVMKHVDCSGLCVVYNLGLLLALCSALQLKWAISSPPDPACACLAARNLRPRMSVMPTRRKHGLKRRPIHNDVSLKSRLQGGRE